MLTNKHNLFVKNLPNNFSRTHLKKLFEKYGRISSLKLNENGTAFVRYINESDADKVIKMLNGTKPNGYNFMDNIVVKLANFDVFESKNKSNVNNNYNYNFNNIYQVCSLIYSVFV